MRGEAHKCSIPHHRILWKRSIYTPSKRQHCVAWIDEWMREWGEIHRCAVQTNTHHHSTHSMAVKHLSLLVKMYFMRAVLIATSAATPLTLSLRYFGNQVDTSLPLLPLLPLFSLYCSSIIVYFTRLGSVFAIKHNIHVSA